MSGSTAPRIDAVVLDYGGVLTSPVRESIAAWLAADGIDPASFSRTLKAWLGRGAAPGTPIHRLETGKLPIPEFEATLAAELTTDDGRPVVAEGVLTRLFAGIRPDEEMYDLVGRLRALGVRTALLSNSWGNTYPRERIDRLFDAVVISGEVGLRKPDPDIYRLALDRLGVEPEHAAFLDDAEPNLDGARAIGMHAVLHIDAASTAAALARLSPGLALQNGGSTR